MKIYGENYDISIKFSKIKRYKVNFKAKNERLYLMLLINIKIASCHSVYDKLHAFKGFARKCGNITAIAKAANHVWNCIYVLTASTPPFTEALMTAGSGDTVERLISGEVIPGEVTCIWLMWRFPRFYRAACNADAVLWWEFCPSVCHTRVLWQNGRKICPDLYTIRKNI